MCIHQKKLLQMSKDNLQKFVTLISVCSLLNAPGNGTSDCQNVSDTINCTITCDDGFDFDIQPLDYYICGPDTSYEWNIQSDDNPDGKLPRCSGKYLNLVLYLASLYL